MKQWRSTYKQPWQLQKFLITLIRVQGRCTCSFGAQKPSPVRVTKDLSLHMTSDLSPPSICSMSLKIQNISQGWKEGVKTKMMAFLRLFTYWYRGIQNITIFPIALLMEKVKCDMNWRFFQLMWKEYLFAEQYY